MQINGIDISEWQGLLTLEDFYKIKNQNIDFVIIRCGYTSYGINKGKFIDKYFENNYELAKKVGLNVGTYYYSCAVTEQEAYEETKFILDIIKGKKFEYPIVIDTEDNHDTRDNSNSKISQFTIGKERLTNIIDIICKELEMNNYYVCIYASSYWFNSCLNLNILAKYDKWVAQWSKSRNMAIKHGIWQYSSKGKVNGIYGNVDLDYSYSNYPKIIKDNYLNGFKTDEKYLLTINYLCNNKKIKDSLVVNYKLNDKYEVIVPKIKGYKAKTENSCGIIKKNTIVNIMYSKKNNIIRNKKKKVIKFKNIFLKIFKLLKKMLKNSK